ncbi:MULTISPECIES: hypothetical protein [unclassified Mesorhizobium]|uniref:hypothetical protein n=1 Tax=unclassified Mesorhizobium TaxID=325217 RepID=UPI000FD94609|nr:MULTISPECIES: hypothetical protein [unclassified Mesorhizobium]TGR58245.1 hypothetical protein EN842_01240 [bacterium M00.F.Ca.ET.199.01.1.1]TGU41647.1 hypothetical protein EN799_03575 [bacterium M00.F.Ca.ET.156.01.1.1]TGV89729.1 hypothetical protein EN792_006110 [Mesorhizobium sp. M00.F.Ca.ET.149.01.1.1]TGR32987.1 hypothetical protein EN840_01240 [Mesorhizobium sp. M8A.F.Ca.ET.197.01.1.1]TGR34633.1 hypothetical protein EN845_01240 [Mesorhizobium sp. M8A.F.Ca.ET.202.01.1.1]
MNTLKISFDGASASDLPSSLSEAAECFLEFGYALVDFLESGKEFFLLKHDRGSASGTNEIVVRLDPSDSLVGLVTAFRARNTDFGFLEHFHLPSSDPQFSTSIEVEQS